MAKIQDATPQISVRLYKTISRTTIDGQTPVSTRYSGKDEYIDLTGYLGEGSAVRTSKSIREPAGAFSVTFADKPNSAGIVSGMGPVVALESIHGLIEPMDIVEIRMWGGVGPTPSELPIKMRGFVTEIQRQQTMGQDGKPVRQVVITGQDYGKIWQTYQVIYLQAYSEGIPLLTTYALNELFGIGVVNAMPAGEFVRMMIEKVINPHIARFIPENSPMPKKIETGDGVTVKHGTVNLSYQEIQGSIYDFLKGHSDQPWNELYVEDRQDGVHLVYRPQPALRLSGDAKDRKIMPDAPDPVYVPITDSNIQSYSVSRTDNTVANFYWVTSPRFDLISDMQRKQASIPADDGTVSLKDYPNAAMKYYGTRPLYAETQHGEDTVTNQTSGQDQKGQDSRDNKQFSWIERRRMQLMDINRDNVVLERGSARIKGGPMRRDGKEAMKAGDYALFQFGTITSEAYVTQIDDEFLPFQSYITTLNFERGTGFAERVKMESGRASPWLAEQASFNWLGGLF